MEYARVGASGLKVSRISIGAWLTMGASVADKTSHQILSMALDRGINAIDTADIYARGEAEQVIGNFIVGKPRHELVISTKCYWPMSDDPNDRGLSRKHLVESLHRSLRRLKTDYVDIFYCHRFDAETPLDETILAMDDLIRQGKALYWGTSCWSRVQLSDVRARCEALGARPPIVEQPPYNLLQRGIEDGVLPLARAGGLDIIAFSPLAEGILTGKYVDGIPAGTRAASSRRVQAMLDPEVLASTRRLTEIARDRGVRPEQLALAWAIRQPAISSVIVGATRAEHLTWNLEALSIPWDDALSNEVEAAFAAKRG